MKIFTSVFFIIFTIFKVNAQHETISSTDSLLEEGYNQFDLFVVTFTHEQEFQRELRTTTKYLLENLPVVLTDVYLKEYILNLKGLQSMKKSPQINKCYTGLSEIRKIIQNQAKIYFDTCTKRYYKEGKQEDDLLRSMANAFNTFENDLVICSAPKQHKKKASLRDLCVNNAKTAFEDNLDKIYSLFQNLTTSWYNTDDMVECITVSTNRATDFLRTFNANVKSCVIKSSDVTIDVLDQILYDPEELTPSVFFDQLPNNDSKLDRLIKKLGMDIASLNDTVDNTDSNTVQFTVNTTKILKRSFDDINVTLSEEKQKFMKSERIRYCFEYADIFMKRARNKAQTAIRFCNGCKNCQINNVNEAQDLEKLWQKNYNQVKLDCLGDVSNLFPLGGVKTCIDQYRRKMYNKLSNMEMAVYDLQHDSKAMLKRLEKCLSFVIDVATQNQYDGVKVLENCVRRDADVFEYSFPGNYEPVKYK